MSKNREDTMQILFFRALIIYLLVFTVIRLSGKRQLSQLQPFDLVITLLIADLASEPISDPSIPLAYGVVPIIALFLAQKLLAFLALKSEGIRSIACGKPLIIINRGVVMEETMRKANYSMQDLLEHLRTMSVFDISNVQYAILETSGDLSVMQKSDFSTPTCSDMNIEKSNPSLSYALIIDGKIMSRALSDANLSTSWLSKQLKRIGIKSEKEVLFAVVEQGGTLYIQLKARFGSKLYNVDTGANV